MYGVDVVDIDVTPVIMITPTVSNDQITAIDAAVLAGVKHQDSL